MPHIHDIQPANGALGTETAPFPLAVQYLDTAITLPSGATRWQVTQRYYSYPGASPLNTGEQPLRAGPTFRFTASDSSQNTLHLKLSNTLPANEATHYPPEPPYPGTGSPGVINRPRQFNTTNLHFHGLHVSPLSRTVAGQVGSGLAGNTVLSSDDTFVSLPPVGEAGSTGEQDYQVVLPQFHAPGTHWYHPLNHGSAALQLIDGMVGALIVEEEGDAVIPVDQDLVLLVQEVLRKEAVVQPDPDLAPVPADQMIYNCNPASDRFTINGYDNPTFTLGLGELQRWRLINATTTSRGFMLLKLYKVDISGERTVQNLTVIALDGISFHGRAPKVQPAVALSPGNRADLLVQLDPPGTYELWKEVWEPAKGNLGANAFVESVLGAEGPQQAQLLATITVTDIPVTTPKSIPAIIPGLFPNYLQPITDDLLLRTEPDDEGVSQIYTRPVVVGEYKEPITQNCNFYMVRPSLEDDPGGVQFTKDIKAGVLNPGQANPNPRLYQINGVSFIPHSGEDNISHIPALKLQTAEEANELLDQKKPYNPGQFIAGAYQNQTSQLAKLNTCEQWIIYNYGDSSHVFHMHTYPFQVVEIYTPNDPDNPLVTYEDPAQIPWYDSYPVPPIKYLTETGEVQVGYIKIRLRFTDFWGESAFHSQRLNHADQGMKQILSVLNDDEGTGNNPFTQVETSRVSGPGVSIGTPGALPASYYPPMMEQLGNVRSFSSEAYPPQVQVTTKGEVLGIISDPLLRAW